MGQIFREGRLCVVRTPRRETRNGETTLRGVESRQGRIGGESEGSGRH